VSFTTFYSRYGLTSAITLNEYPAHIFSTIYRMLIVYFPLNSGFGDFGRGGFASRGGARGRGGAADA